MQWYTGVMTDELSEVIGRAIDEKPGIARLSTDPMGRCEYKCVFHRLGLDGEARRLSIEHGFEEAVEMLPERAEYIIGCTETAIEEGRLRVDDEDGCGASGWTWLDGTTGMPSKVFAAEQEGAA